jgi:3-oxoacyl-[acyl-carrier protein] reductase
MLIDYTGKKVLVTGGTKGLGKDFVDSFRNAGAEVWYTGRARNDEDPYHLQVNFVDDPNGQRGWFLEEIGKIGFDVLINNAGTNKIGPIEEYDIRDYEKIIKLNLTSCFETTQAVIPYMKQNGYGRIVNITSISSEISMPLRSAYCSSKFGLLGLTKVSGVELASHGILVNAVGPGVTKTKLTVDVLGEEKMDEISKNVPIGRLGEVEDVSNVVMFMASDLNTYMVGQNILVDGGYTCV